jgi:hypothetical protein
MTEYLRCPQHKSQGHVPVGHCHKKQCIFLTSENGELRCGYGDTTLPKRPKVNKIGRDGAL